MTHLFLNQKNLYLADFEKPRIYKIPDYLEDQLTQKVNEFKKSKTKELIKKTCEKNFIRSKNKRHFIRGRLPDGVKPTVGKIKISDLTPHTLGFPKHLYGDVFHDDLWKYASNTREEFSESPFINALKDWISKIINEIAEEPRKKQR